MPSIRNSWVWTYDAGNKPLGKTYHEDAKGNKAWKCRLCWESPRPVAQYYTKQGGTAAPSRHLKKKHKVLKPLEHDSDDDKSISPATLIFEDPANASGSLETAWRGVKYANKRQKTLTRMEDVEADHLKELFLDWIIECQLPFRHCEKKSFKAFMSYMNPCGGTLLPISGTTVSKYVMERFKTKKDAIRLLLRSSISRIHVSCDNWTSSNSGAAYIGITVRFVTRKGRQQFVLAMRELKGAHSGPNMAEVFLGVVQDYGIEHNLGFCNADNATNNDTMCAQMEKDMLANGIVWDANLYRMRCAGHICNLAVQALLFGKHPNTDKDPELPSADDITAWRKLGALGKLHNIIIWIYHSPQRREVFLGLSNNRALVRDNKTRWTSWFEAIVRALELREPLNMWGLLTQADKNIKKDDKPPQLLEEDWTILQTYADILGPYKEVTLATEGYGDGLNMILTGMDLLLDHLEAAKTTYFGDAIFKAAIETSWDVMEKYYKLTDNSPAYAAAIVMDPRWKWHYFTKHWTTPIQQGFHAKAKTAVSLPFLGSRFTKFYL